MRGLMQDFPLTLVHLFDRAERLFPTRTITTVTGTGDRERISYGAWAARTRRLGGVLDALGISADGRVATFGWNSARHLELYFAAPCSGRVLHALNIRLFAEQLTYIVNHAADEVIFVDRSLTPLLFPLLPTFTTVRHLVVMDDGKGDVPANPTSIPVHDYETLLAAASPVEFHVADEGVASAICYTSGTTGNPKGVIYSHRSSFLHSMGLMTADSLAVSERDVVLPVVPMFHANSWGLPHACAGVGASLVMPGPDLSPGNIARLIVDERVTLTAGVPTIWMGALAELAGKDTSALRGVMCGGSAVPKALSEAYRAQIGLPILQGWGMTETQPLCTVGRIKASVADLDEDALADVRAAQGLPTVGVEVRIVEPDTIDLLPWDGKSSGELQARGPWIAASYYNDERAGESFTSDGWLRTGDVAVIDPEGYVRLVDRTKDLIKSGGEWISSVDIENELMGHPKIAEAAVIGVPHPKWDERPLACVVVRPGETLTPAEVLEFLAPRLAKWQLPDDVVFIDEVPKTSVGKFSKKTLRERFAAHVLPGA
ncbi:MAG: long-chain fatty acid--CoA ligase [Acidimicrobiales bacterium]